MLISFLTLFSVVSSGHGLFEKQQPKGAKILVDKLFRLMPIRYAYSTCLERGIWYARSGS